MYLDKLEKAEVKKQILIINSDKKEAGLIKNRLDSASSEVYIATTIQEAMNMFLKYDFCLIILDACMSDEDDHKLLTSMRNAKATPIMVLSSHNDSTHRIHALQAGAHAYMGKPYTDDEWMAQAHALMELYLETAPQGKLCYTLAFGNDLIIDPSTRQVFLKGNELKVTKKEFDILFWLASHPGKVFSKEQLYDHVWDDQSAYNVDDVVKAHIKALRQKLSAADIEYIKNVWGVGYRFHNETSNA